MTTANITATNTPRVTVIDPRAPEKAKLRVAAYARVSSDSEDQVNSYIAQVDFYSKHIAGKEEWEMVDIYADEGISGLEARNRDEFNRMMVDCREGKIDRVLCKSISRFARNTQEYIQFVRELLRLGISIHFEKENIDTGKMTSEQIAQIYGAFAQMESTSHSSNMRFSVRTVGSVALSAARRSRVGKHTGSAAVMIVTRQTAPFLRFPSWKSLRRSCGSITS